MQTKSEYQVNVPLRLRDQGFHSGSIHTEMRLPIQPLPAGRAQYDVVGLGLNSIDLYAVFPGPLKINGKQQAKTLVKHPGGQTATALVTCATLGWRGSYIGHFGEDEHGELSRSSLIRAGVDVSHSKIVPGATNQFACILVDQRTGDRTVIWDRHRGLAMTDADVPLAAVASGRVLLVDCGETRAASKAAQHAKQAGIPSVIDVERVKPGIEELLDSVDIIIAAEEFPSSLTGEPVLGKAIRQLSSQFNPTLTVVTLGAEGSLALMGGKEIRSPAIRVDAIDTTGAGDAFRGGFVSSWLATGADAEVSELLKYANVVAGLNCRALGARGGIPTKLEVDNKLQT